MCWGGSVKNKADWGSRMKESAARDKHEGSQLREVVAFQEEPHLLFLSPNLTELASQGPSHFTNLVFQLPHQFWRQVHILTADSYWQRHSGNYSVL